MSVCDMCNKEIVSRDGYLATTRQVVSNPAYWEKAFSRIGDLAAPGANLVLLKGGLAEQQAKQAKPWLLCAECAGRLELATPEAREFARRWWSSGGTFEPPGSGPVPLSAVRLTRPSAEVLATGVPRPTRSLVFGRGFVPGEAEVGIAVKGLLMSKGKLTSGHFKDIPVECESRQAASREVFFSVVDEVRRWNPSAFILDMLVLDQRTGRDLAILAVWEGDDAETTRRQFPADVSAGPSSSSAGRIMGVPTKALKRRPPKKWTRVLGVVLIVWGIVMVLGGIGLMPRPGSPVPPRTVTDRAGSTRELTPREAASIPMGIGTVMAGLGIWLTLRRRERRQKRAPAGTK
jgi:hypothetical protein